jgi:hypothetical protein
MAMIALLADNNFGDTRSGGMAGPTGLVIILLLIVGTVLLIRNMNQRLRRLPERFEAQHDRPHDKQGAPPADQDKQAQPSKAEPSADEVDRNRPR